MTRVCLVGDDDVVLQYELLSRETAREALATYDLQEPFDNSVALETMSLGAAVALLNDLNWYLIRFVETALVLEPSVSDEEWLSRDLAAAIRDGQNMIILTYATPNGRRYFRKERALTSFTDVRDTTAAVDADPDNLGTVTDEDLRERYATEARRMADQHDPADVI